jgi:cytochrome b
VRCWRSRSSPERSRRKRDRPGNLTGPNALLEARTKFVHEVVAKLLIAAIGLHVAAALKHHVADKDTILLRMLPFCHDDRRP